MPRFTVTKGEWTPLVIEEACLVQNINMGKIRIVKSDTEPANTDVEGFTVSPTDMIKLKAGNYYATCELMNFSYGYYDYSMPAVTGGGTVDSLASSSVTFVDNVPLPTAIGGLEAGAVLGSTNILNVLNGLLHPYQAPSVNISSPSSTGYYTKGEDSISFTSISVTVTPGTNPVSQYRLYVNGSVVSEQSAGADPLSWTPAVNETFNSNTTVYARAYDAVKDQWVQSNTLTYTFVNPIFYGVGAHALTMTQVAALTARVRPEGNFSASFTTDNEAFYIAFPAAYGNLSSVKDPNNFEILGDFTLRTANLTTTLDGDVLYNIYEFDNLTTMSNYVLSISF